MSEKQSSPPPSAPSKWADRLSAFGHAVRSRVSGIFGSKKPGSETGAGERAALEQRLVVTTAYRGSAERRYDIENAEKLFDKDFLGPKQFEKAWGFCPEHVPPIPFSAELLARAKKLGMILRLSVDRTRDETPMSMKIMNAMQAKNGKNPNVLHPNTWYKNSDFFSESPRMGWRLESKSILKNSTNKNEVEQLELIVDHLQRVIFSEIEMPVYYQNAISQFEAQKAQIKTLIESEEGESAALAMIEALELCKLTRATPAEMIQGIETHHQNNEKGTFLYPNISVRTPRRRMSKRLVTIGYVRKTGIDVCVNSPGDRWGNLGIALSLQA